MNNAMYILLCCLVGGFATFASLGLHRRLAQQRNRRRFTQHDDTMTRWPRMGARLLTREEIAHAPLN
jgi:Flp pilus assembly protein protease CpaA